MGRKVRYQYLTGSLMEPFLQFVVKLQFGVNPVSDPRGTRIANHMYKEALKTRPRYKGQKFVSTFDYNFASNSSYVVFNYINGYKWSFHLKEVEMIDLQQMHDYLSRLVEYQRSLAGFEDEYEDEERWGVLSKE